MKIFKYHYKNGHEITVLTATNWDELFEIVGLELQLIIDHDDNFSVEYLTNAFAQSAEYLTSIFERFLAF